MVRIITDSSADIEPEVLEKMNVICVPMNVAFGDTEYQENLNLSKEQFYKLLEESEELPRTSQPTPVSFLNIMEELKENGDEAVFILLSSALSGTYQNALMYKDMTEYDKCYIVDSLSATAGERLLVEIAVKLRAEGKNGAEIKEALDNIKSKVTIHACIDTLEYLYKGGRISKVSFAVGNLAKVKPIIYVSREGTVEVPTKVIGRGRGIKYVSDKVGEEKPDLNYPVYVLYTKDKTNAMRLYESLKESGLNIPEENILNVGSVIGTHVGPNGFGIAYISE